MVINDKYNFVFIHVPKSAGTSVMSALSEIPGDNLRWIGKTKHETLGQMVSALAEPKSLMDRFLLRNPLNYYSFGFVRNPWDRMSSFYRYLKEVRPRVEIDSVPSFNDFLLQAEDRVEWIQGLYGMKAQLEFFSLPTGEIDVDFLGHYEFLNEDIAMITKDLGCQFELPRYNSSSNANRDYRCDYDDRLVEVVSRLFRSDIDVFDYSFEVREPGRRFSCPYRG